MTNTRLFCSLLVAVWLCVSPSQADADTRTARVLYTQAEKRFASGDYQAALTLYRQAYAAKPLAGFHFNIALCLRKLGRHAEAVKHFKQYLELSKSTRNKKRAQELLAECEAAVEAAKPPPKPEDPLPTPPVVAKPAPLPTKARGRRRLPSGYFWTAVAVSGTLVAVGTVTGIIALTKSSTFRDPSTPNSELSGLQDTGEALKTTSTITWTVGAITAAGAAALYFFTDFGKETSVAAAPTRDGAVVTLVGRF